MKSISKIISFALVISTAFVACKKIDKADGPYQVYNSGTAVVLSSSAATVAPDRADSIKTAITFNWTDAVYAVDSAHTKYVLQIDTVGGNFSNPFSKEIIGNLSTSFLAKELNAILIDRFGLKPGTSNSINTRIVSSYINNNDLKISNVLTIQATPYLVPPKVVPPASRALVLVGSATVGGWDNLAPLPAQGFTMIDSVTYEGTFFLNGGGFYILLPVSGSWDGKYNVADKTLPGLSAGGVFGLGLADDIPGPEKTGMYKILVDFQNGKFTVTKESEFGLLYMPGDYQGWNPASSQTIGSAANDGSFDGYVNIPAGGTNEFKFTTTPDWSNAYGDGGSGTLDPGGPSNLSVPAAGYYHLKGNTTANTWSAEPVSWGLVGSFAASNWSNGGATPDVPMVYNATDDKWVGTITTVAGDEFKFRANNDWGKNFGDNGDGSLVLNGENIGKPGFSAPVTAGTHTITLYLSSPGYYTYRIQ